MSTLCMSQCDPPFEKSWLRPWFSTNVDAENIFLYEKEIQSLTYPLFSSYYNPVTISKSQNDTTLTS